MTATDSIQGSLYFKTTLGSIKCGLILQVVLKYRFSFAQKNLHFGIKIGGLIQVVLK